jgi:hypothetical protein
VVLAALAGVLAIALPPDAFSLRRALAGAALLALAGVVAFPPARGAAAARLALACVGLALAPPGAFPLGDLALGAAAFAALLLASGDRAPAFVPLAGVAAASVAACMLLRAWQGDVLEAAGLLLPFTLALAALAAGAAVAILRHSSEAPA